MFTLLVAVAALQQQQPRSRLPGHMHFEYMNIGYWVGVGEKEEGEPSVLVHSVWCVVLASTSIPLLHSIYYYILYIYIYSS